MDTADPVQFEELREVPAVPEVGIPGRQAQNDGQISPHFPAALESDPLSGLEPQDHILRQVREPPGRDDQDALPSSFDRRYVGLTGREIAERTSGRVNSGFTR